MIFLTIVLSALALAEGTIPECTDGTVTYVNCSSEGYNYVKCPVDGVRTIFSASIVLKYEREPPATPMTCTTGFGSGYLYDFVWVDQGCRVLFEVCAEFKVTSTPQTATNPATVTTQQATNPATVKTQTLTTTSVTTKAAVVEALKQQSVGDCQCCGADAGFAVVAVLCGLSLLALLLVLFGLVFCRRTCEKVFPSTKVGDEERNSAATRFREERHYARKDIPYAQRFSRAGTFYI